VLEGGHPGKRAGNPERRRRLEASNLQGLRRLAGETTRRQGESLWGTCNVTPRNVWRPRCADEGLPNRPAREENEKKTNSHRKKINLKRYVRSRKRRSSGCGVDLTVKMQMPQHAVTQHVIFWQHVMGTFLLTHIHFANINTTSTSSTTTTGLETHLRLELQVCFFSLEHANLRTRGCGTQRWLHLLLGVTLRVPHNDSPWQRVVSSCKTCKPSQI